MNERTNAQHPFSIPLLGRGGDGCVSQHTRHPVADFPTSGNLHADAIAISGREVLAMAVDRRAGTTKPFVYGIVPTVLVGIFSECVFIPAV
jgi:hypothetical protein